MRSHPYELILFRIAILVGKNSSISVSDNLEEVILLKESKRLTQKSHMCTQQWRNKDSVYSGKNPRLSEGGVPWETFVFQNKHNRHFLYHVRNPYHALEQNKNQGSVSDGS